MADPLIFLAGTWLSQYIGLMRSGKFNLLSKNFATFLRLLHNQQNPCKLILSILKDFKVATKIRSITSDSNSAMPPAMRIVRRKLKNEHGLHFDCEAFYIWCFSHIINCAVFDATPLIREEVYMIH